MSFFFPDKAVAFGALALSSITSPAAVVNSPSQAAVAAAISSVSAGPIDYGWDYTNGAFTGGSWSGGASITLAVASHAGNTTADAMLLRQIRFTLTAGNEIIANGGYPAQHERHVTGMFAIVKYTPRIWDQLSAAEKKKIDLIMKAAFVASAFTTSNSNPYLTRGQRTLDGDTNLGRDWNPNYREGMLGGVLVGMVYFGGPTAADALLKSYNHAAFVAELSANGLPNIHKTFTYTYTPPKATPPTPAEIESTVKSYKYYNSDLQDYAGIYNSLVNDTYGATVSPGLNNGAGVYASNVGGYAGMIVTGAATLPNRGAIGMLKEFASTDANGPRSSLEYAYDGYRPHQTNQLVLVIGGFWQKDSAIAKSAVARIKVGNTDMWYKMEKSYYDYAKGRFQDTRGPAFGTQRGAAYLRSLWDDVLLPYHESVTEPDPDPTTDSDGDGTPDVIETRLGLDPQNPTSRFSLTLESGNGLRWVSAVGLSFVIQRSSDTSAMVWQTIATVPGLAGATSFVDPDPPADRAFYRVGLNP